MRRHFIENPQDWDAGVIVSTITVNWPFSDQDAVYLDSSTQRVIMRPAYVEHVRNLNSWTIDRSVLESMPFLEGKARFKSVGRAQLQVTQGQFAP